MSDLFVTVSRNKTRWPSPKGDLSVEQLWDLPLTSERGVSLNGIAVEVNRELKSITDESFVTPVPNKRRKLLTLQLDVVKEIIRVRLEENAAASAAASNRAERDRLEAIMAARQDKAMEGLSDEDIQKRLDQLKSAN